MGLLLRLWCFLSSQILFFRCFFLLFWTYFIYLVACRFLLPFSFFSDPWWNPAAEMQAIDRTHRIGQYKPIFATRFILENTIEERILKLQEKKQLVFDSTVGGDAASLARLTVDDLRFLFSNN